MPARNQRGFTLLELLVVVGTVAVLFAIAVPQYAAYRERAQLSSAVSNCRTLYHAFTVFYLKNSYEYPSNEGEGYEEDFERATFWPLTNIVMTDGVDFDSDIAQLLSKLGGDPNDRVYFTDDPNYQSYYLVLPWGRDPNLLLIIASSDMVKDKDNNLIDGGNWLDGVFVWDKAAGQIMYR
jgi:type IV pilus assembly protein PilA